MSLPAMHSPSPHMYYRDVIEAHDTATMAFWAKEISERMSGTR